MRCSFSRAGAFLRQGLLRRARMRGNRRLRQIPVIALLLAGMAPVVAASTATAAGWKMQPTPNPKRFSTGTPRRFVRGKGLAPPWAPTRTPLGGGLRWRSAGKGQGLEGPAHTQPDRVKEPFSVRRLVPRSKCLQGCGRLGEGYPGRALDKWQGLEDPVHAEPDAGRQARF